MSGIEERIAEIIGAHRPRRLRVSRAVEECQSGCVYEPETWYRHIASVLVAELGMTAQYGAHDITQADDTDADLWWTDDPADGFVARDAARNLLNSNNPNFPNHELVRRFVTAWERAQ